MPVVNAVLRLLPLCFGLCPRRPVPVESAQGEQFAHSETHRYSQDQQDFEQDDQP